jgi:hypothetical protein
MNPTFSPFPELPDELLADPPDEELLELPQALSAPAAAQTIRTANALRNLVMKLLSPAAAVSGNAPSASSPAICNTLDVGCQEDTI